MKSVPVVNLDPRAVRVSFPSDEHFQVDFADGRSIIVPIAWSERLARATPVERHTFQITAGGDLIRWEALDEDIEVRALLAKDKVLVWPDANLGHLGSSAGPDASAACSPHS